MTLIKKDYIKNHSSSSSDEPRSSSGMASSSSSSPSSSSTSSAAAPPPLLPPALSMAASSSAALSGSSFLPAASGELILGVSADVGLPAPLWPPPPLPPLATEFMKAAVAPEAALLFRSGLAPGEPILGVLGLRTGLTGSGEKRSLMAAAVAAVTAGLGLEVVVVGAAAAAAAETGAEGADAVRSCCCCEGDGGCGDGEGGASRMPRTCSMAVASLDPGCSSISTFANLRLSSSPC